MRRVGDFYETSRVATLVLLDYLPMSLGTVFEPTAGRNAITNVLRPRCTRIETNDINPSFGHLRSFDACLRSTWTTLGFRPDWVITNPPFGSAFTILELALEYAKVGVAFLLRLSFLEPTREREDLLVNDPPTKLVVLPRYSFTENGKTDTVTCAWMIWQFDQRGTIHVARRFK